MISKNLKAIFLFILLGIVIILCYGMFKSYLSLIILTLVMTSVTYPVFSKLQLLFKNHKSLSASISCLIVLICIIGPVFFIGIIIIQELIAGFSYLSSLLDFERINENLDPKNFPYIVSFFKEYAPFVNIEQIDFKKEILSFSTTASKFLISYSTEIVSNIGTQLFNILLMIVGMFFLYRDGDELLKWLTHLSPLAESYEKRIIEKFKDISKSVFIGVFLTALAQGIVASIGFTIIGVSPLIFGLANAIFSLIPIVGTALLWLPAGLILILLGNTWEGIFIMIWCFVLGMFLENYIRPMLIKGKANLHPFITFLAIMGGISYFGILGIIFGPLIVSIGIILFDIYHEEYKVTLDELDKQ